MRTHEIARTLGFALPTVAVITVSHVIVDGFLVRDHFRGELLDGIVSGVWFASLFGIGCALRLLWTRLSGAGATSALDSFGRAALDGLMVGVLLWAGLMAFWSVVPHKGPDFPSTLVFWAQSSLMALMGALVPRLRAFGVRRAA